MIEQVNTLETLLKMNEDDICAILTNNSIVQTEEPRRLLCAINNLKRCQHCIKIGTKEPTDMYWDSWDRRHHIRTNNSPRTHHRMQPVIMNDINHSDDLMQSPIELSPPETQISTSSLQTTTTSSAGGGGFISSTITSTSTDKLLNMISPEDGSGVSNNLSPSPSPPHSPSVNTIHNLQSSSSNTKPRLSQHNNNHNNINNNNNHNNHHLHHHSNSNNNNDVIINNSSNFISTHNSLNNNDIQLNENGACADDTMSKSKSNDSQLSVNGHNNHHHQLHHHHHHHHPNKHFNGSSIQDQNNHHHHHQLQQHNDAPIPAPRTRFGEYIDSHVNDGHTVTPIINDPPPRSPCTPVRGMGHMIQHRFSKKFKFTSSTCDLCNKQMFFGFKCTECKYRCHKDCKSNVPPSCGLPKEFVDEFKKTLYSDGLLPNSSPNMQRTSGGLLSAKRNEIRPRPPIHSIPFHPDSSSAGSSCNSSSPSSPALQTIPPQTPATSKQSQFNFPEVSHNSLTSTMQQHSYHTNNTIIEDVEQEQHSINKQHQYSEPQVQMRNNFTNNYQHSLNSMINNDIINHPHYHQQMLNGSIIDSNGKHYPTNFHPVPRLHLSELSDSHQSNDSDKTVTNSIESDRTTDMLRMDSVDVDERENMWPRQNSLSLKEWDIPYDDLNLLEKIGMGRFGTVHRALWHGDVAVKILKEDYLDEHTIEAFKVEVAIFKNTRHENLVLFMGACMKPPRLAIVTSLCKGNTLYTHIHLRKDKFNLNRTTLVAQQISQGMGYLHSRGIVHKDLKTKNIFLENEKVIITDFGLFSVTKLLYCDMGLGIPSGWLCYLAPELIRNLKPYRPTNEDLPFSKASDIYAFGTIWYELLCGEFPFKAQPSESIIWQVGRGMKQSLANLQASRDVKDILMMCWSFQADDRRDFGIMLGLLERLPKKRLARSPSHPIQLSRSAESVF